MFFRNDVSSDRVDWLWRSWLADTSLPTLSTQPCRYQRGGFFLLECSGLRDPERIDRSGGGHWQEGLALMPIQDPCSEGVVIWRIPGSHSLVADDPPGRRRLRPQGDAPWGGR
jgi:hypothetical protein